MGYFQDLGTGMTVEPMNASTDAQEARAFGWELAGLMLEALRGPVSSDEAAAIGEHAADVIAERVSRLPSTDDGRDAARLWADAASWGFRDRMAIAREIVEPDSQTTAAVADLTVGETDDAALRLLGGRDDRLEAQAEQPKPARTKASRSLKAKSKPGKAKGKEASPGARRRHRPAPVP